MTFLPGDLPLSGAAISPNSMDSDDPWPSWMNGFKIGDMVWGKVKSHPWWPGHIFNEEFASPAVRRTKRGDNHVLVAFYGDSSYGWFEPSELIPFEPHFPEKSRQTISRTFAKAVEEAVDEASRRGALGISCLCRNPRSVRPTAVPNYFSVDVDGFEPGGLYSSEQIQESKESFAPDGSLFFVRDLALAPRKDEACRSVDWIKRMAAVLAYRRAVYEEFDETYAQAFGVEPVRPSQNDSVVPDHPMRALSGPLVVAEALSDKKTSSSSSRSTKSLTSSSKKKKNKYLLKRRDETRTSTPPLPDFRRHPNDSPLNTSLAPADFCFDPAPPLSPPQASRSISALPDATPPPALPAATSVPSAKTDSYVLQKRPSAEKPQPMQEDIIELPPKSAAPDAQRVSTDQKAQQLPQVPKEQPDSGDSVPMKLDPAVGVGDVTSVFTLDEKPPSSYVKDDGSQPKLEASSLPVDPAAAGAVPCGQKLAVKAPAEVVKPVLFGVVDREKVRKQMNLDDTGDIKKKNKKKKRIDGTIINLSETPKDVKKKKMKKMKRLDETIMKLSETPKNGDAGEALMKKKKKRREDTVTDLSLTPKDGGEPRRRLGAEFSQTELKMKRPEVQRAVLPPKLNFDSAEHDLPRILTDLSAIAMDPFHGSECNAPDIVRHVFLRFRSKVYQKSLFLLSDGDDDAPATVARITTHADRSQSDTVPGKDINEQREQKPPKSIVKTDDPTKAGRKRGPSDRQEELIAQRHHTLKRIKALAEEKKTGIISQKAPERDPKNMAVAVREPVKESVKKQEPAPAPRKISPTYLQLKFPYGSPLPSIATLKAKFARFGQLDVFNTRVFWNSYSCRVLFMCKADAEDACNYAKNNELFGQVKVNYHLKERDLPVREERPADPGNGRRESFPHDNGPQFRPGNGNGGPMYPPTPSDQRQQSLVQARPSLKKPLDEAGSVKKSSKLKVRFKIPPVSSNDNGGGGVEAVPKYPVPVLEQPSKNHNSADFGPPPPVPPPFNPHHSHPFHSQPPPTMLDRCPPATTALFPASHPFIHQYPPMSLAPPLLPTPMPLQPPHYENRLPVPFSEALPPRPSVLPIGGEAERGSGKADISSQMLNLLLRCSSIVTNVKSMSGYVPYSPL